MAPIVAMGSNRGVPAIRPCVGQVTERTYPVTIVLAVANKKGAEKSSSQARPRSSASRSEQRPRGRYAGWGKRVRAGNLGRAYYRVVRHNPPHTDDFLSVEAEGATRVHWETDRHREGFSVFGTRAQAASVASFLKEDRRWRRAYIAQIWVENGGPLTVEPSGDAADGHYTMWGDPHVVRNASSVVSIV